jgi:fimX-like protein
VKDRVVLFLLLLLTGFSVKSQNVAIKSNLLYDAIAVANLGVEVPLAPRWTVDLSANLNAWTINEHKWKHWLLQPEARYWLCDRFQGHFFGVHAIAGQYNVGNLHNNIKFLGTDFSDLTHNRYQGWMFGAGLAYGYSWILAKHWNIEAEIGLGWIHTRSDVYPCAECGTKIAEDKNHDYVGPTKAAVSLIYLF